MDYRPSETATVSEQAPAQVRVELFAVATEPTGTPLQLAAAAIVRDRGVPFRGKSRLPIGSRWLRAADVQNWLAGSDERKPSQQQELGSATAILDPTLVTVIHDDAEQADATATLPSLTLLPDARGFRARLTSGTAAQADHETLLIRAPFGPGEAIGLYVPDARAGTGGILLLARPNGIPPAADLAVAHNQAHAKASNPAAEPEVPRSWRVVEKAIGAQNRRPALLALVAPLGLQRITDLILAADERGLIAMSDEVTQLDPAAEATKKNMPWLVEAAAWRALVPRAERDELTPALRAAFARHVGGLTDDASTIRLLLNTCADLPAFESALIEENLAALNDRSAAVRVRAMQWLGARGVRVADYDPLAKKGDRRAAVRQFFAQREHTESKSETGR